MFENIMKFFKKFGKNEKENSKTTAKERLHLVLAQDRANISADFLDMMKQEIIEVIKKYIDIDEEAIDVRMTNKPGEDGTVGAPALYANIPILTIKNDARKLVKEKSVASEDEKVEVAATIEEEKTDVSEEIENKPLEEKVPEEKQSEVKENKEEKEEKKEEVKTENNEQSEEKNDAVEKIVNSPENKPKGKNTKKAKNKKRGTNK